jgi:hypothetical protein
MDLKKNIQDIYKVFINDETLLRLLYYKPVDANDYPLDSSKPNLLDMSATDRQAIIDDRIYFTKSVDKLDTTPLCRIIIYPGRRKPSVDNYKTPTQEFIFDVMAHKDYQNVDVRCQWICDRINDLIFENRITGIKTVKNVNGQPIAPPAPNYEAYRLTYEFGSVN